MADFASLNFRVSQDVKEDFEAAVADEYGTSDSFARFVLERELRAELNRGTIATLREEVNDLADTLDESPREKEERRSAVDYFSRGGGDKTLVRYRVSADLRKEIMEQQRDAFRSSNEFVEAVMKRYAETGGVLTRITETVTDLAEEDSRQHDDAMTKSERIASHLDEAFTKNDFLTAAEKEGIGTEKYALDEYLQDVLEEKDAVPAPKAREKFVPRGSMSDAELIDPTRLPYHAMTRKQKRIAIKATAFRELNAQGMLKLEPTEGCDILDGRPNSSTVRALFREISQEGPDNGFAYDEGALKVNGSQAKEADWDNETALLITGNLDDAETEPSNHSSQDSTFEQETTERMESLEDATPVNESSS